MIELNNQEMDLAFNVENKLQALVVGSDLDFTGYIIDVEGKILHEAEFSFETILPPSAEKYLEGYLYAKEQDIYIYEGIMAVCK